MSFKTGAAGATNTMSEPSDEEIATVIDITGFGHGEDRDVVIQALKVGEKDLEMRRSLLTYLKELWPQYRESN